MTITQRHPDEILAVLDQAQTALDAHWEGDFDLRLLLWEALDDVRSSYRLAMEGASFDPERIDEVQDIVLDYLANHYGDD